MKLNPNIALLIVLVVVGLIFSGILLALLWYFLAFIIGLAAKCGVWVLFLGAVVLFFSGIEILAMHNK